MENFDLRSPDGTRLKAYRWTPEGPPKADILLVHGGFEHLNRYDHVGQYFANAGYQVIGVDLRGHGLSEGKRGYVERWHLYVEDIRSAIATLDGNYFILCHSMGGLITLDHLRTASSVRGVIASAPLLGIAIKAPAIKKLAARLLSKITPSLSMANELDGALLCSDAIEEQKYKNDPLIFSTITPRWYTEMVAATERVHGFAGNYRTPLYLTYGTEDGVVSTDAIDTFSKQYGGPVQVKVWPGLFHEILNEPNRNDIMLGAVNWLEDLIDPKKEDQNEE
jgi:alpha-beta hydrolase superfamily lysophospholipase